MSLRKYWQRHPVQLRLAALILLVLIPVTTPLFALAIHWREILEAFAEQYRDTWCALTRGE
ncbi:hypothetical protein [Paraburkholderia atlantica]|uniref:hypothetical protein n=1 Tax=Paraburkholderia atlantica TaxID=2654982 RepID=UPI001608BE94|nr:hypothetical protein [Paraburkholderia atlantica]MBB5414077.1 hypothetical protein [Paraburkholderia atlantica]